MRVRKRVDPDGRGGGELPGAAEGGETIIREYYVRKEYIFHKREKEIQAKS